MKSVFQSFTAALFLFSFLLSTSCATIFGKTSYPLRIDSSPSQARVTVTDKKGKQIYSGVTPATLTVKPAAGYFSAASYQINLSKEGFEPVMVTLNAKLNGWYFGNLLIGGFLGLLIIDPITGAMFKMKEFDVKETLSPVSNK